MPVLLGGQLLAASCGGDGPVATTHTVAAGEEFRLAEDHLGELEGGLVQVRVTGFRDQRCPTDLLCPGGLGFARVTAALYVGEGGVGEVMTRNVGDPEPTLELDGWRLTFIDLAPAVRPSDEPIDLRSYRARLRIDPIP